MEDPWQLRKLLGLEKMGGEGWDKDPLRMSAGKHLVAAALLQRARVTEVILVWGRQNKNLKGLKKFRKETRVTDNLAEGLSFFLFCVCL